MKDVTKDARVHVCVMEMDRKGYVKTNKPSTLSGHTSSKNFHVRLSTSSQTHGRLIYGIIVKL